MAAQTTAAPPATALAASVEGVTFSYPTPEGERLALDSLTLEVPAGGVLGLLGPNGSGKSTLLSILACLRQPAAGRVTVLGETPSAALRARIGVLFQETCLDPLMTPRETLALVGRLHGLGGHDLRQRIDSLLDAVGLATRANALISTLSGGMKRRLELARVLLHSPGLLLLDEPTTGVDPDAEAAVWSLIGNANRDGVTVVLATNNVAEADRRCDRVAFLHEGRLAAEGAPAELKAGLKRDSVLVDWPDVASPLVDEISGWDGVGAMRWSPPTLHATVDDASRFVPRLFALAGPAQTGARRGGIRGVRIRESTLEDAYFDIVGAAISGGGDA
ncbi:MAG: ABC transporter ATP-binding protein [Dehalococcoidia bacterium]